MWQLDQQSHTVLGAATGGHSTSSDRRAGEADPHVTPQHSSRCAPQRRTCLAILPPWHDDARAIAQRATTHAQRSLPHQAVAGLRPPPHHQPEESAVDTENRPLAPGHAARPRQEASSREAKRTAWRPACPRDRDHLSSGTSKRMLSPRTKTLPRSSHRPKALSTMLAHFIHDVNPSGIDSSIPPLALAAASLWMTSGIRGILCGHSDARCVAAPRPIHEYACRTAPCEHREWLADHARSA